MRSIQHSIKRADCPTPQFLLSDQQQRSLFDGFLLRLCVFRLGHGAHERRASHADIFPASTIGAIRIVDGALGAGDEIGCMDRVRLLSILFLVEVEEHPIMNKH